MSFNFWLISSAGRCWYWLQGLTCPFIYCSPLRRLIRDPVCSYLRLITLLTLQWFNKCYTELLSASFEPFGHSLECRAACSVKIGAYAPAAANSPYRLNGSLRNIAYCEFTQAELKRSPAGPMIKGNHLNLESGLWEREQGLRISNCTKTTAVSHETRPKQTRRRSETEAEGESFIVIHPHVESFLSPAWLSLFLEQKSHRRRTTVFPIW